MNETKHTPGQFVGMHNSPWFDGHVNVEIAELERLRAVNAQLLGALVTWRNWADDNPEVPNRLNGPVAAQVDAAIAAAEGGVR